MPNSRPHPVLQYSGLYSLVHFCYHGFSWTPEDHYIEMTLQKESAVVRLRFERPRQLVINEYFPTQMGLFISDISEQQLEDLTVEVGDYENGSIRFFAKSVERI